MSHDTPASLQYKKLWQQGGQFMQRRLTCGVVKGPHASVARALDVGEIVVHEKRLFWRHTQPLGGKLIDACVRLQQPLLDERISMSVTAPRPRRFSRDARASGQALLSSAVL